MISKPLSPHQRLDICMKCCVGTVGTQLVRTGVVSGNCDVPYLCIYIYLVYSVHRIRKQSIFTYFVLLDGLVLLYNCRMQGEIQQHLGTGGYMHLLPVKQSSSFLQ